MAWQDRSQEMFPGDFRRAKDTKGPQTVFFAVRSSQLSIENEIRAEVDQRGPKILGSKPQIPNCDCVDGKAPVWVDFTFVDRVVNRTVYDDVWLMLGKLIPQARSFRDVQVATARTAKSSSPSRRTCARSEPTCPLPPTMTIFTRRHAAVAKQPP